MILNSLLALLLLSLYGCQEKEFKASQVLGGVSVSIEVLNHGAQIYQAKCLSCHGAKGDGAGITYRALRIKPRNLTQGLYKFGLSVDGGLPADQDFHQILERGLVGTPMIPWKLKVEERHAVIQYIKTFAPQVWGEKYQSPTRHEFSDGRQCRRC
jgi:mono/diheme cytochrome c family protein